MGAHTGIVFVGVLWSAEQQAYRVMLSYHDPEADMDRVVSFIPSNGGKVGGALLQYSGLVALLNAGEPDEMMAPSAFLERLLGAPHETSFEGEPALFWTGMPTEISLSDEEQ